MGQHRQERILAPVGLPQLVDQAQPLVGRRDVVADGPQELVGKALPGRSPCPSPPSCPSPANAILEVAGPESLSVAAFVGKALAANGDGRSVVADPRATYYGAALDDKGLAPRGANPRIGPTRFEEWVSRAGSGG